MIPGRWGVGVTGSTLWQPSAWSSSMIPASSRAVTGRPAGAWLI
ncbi:MAG: hypothetical protein NTY86_03685 [Deltaproteobacteria bacterium]|nr:hypothetical protein [Deltaproteobacteria bacterium]